MDSLTFQPIFSTTMTLVIAAIAALMLFVGPSFKKIEFRQRLTLSLLRLGVLCLAFLAVLRPGCVDKVEQNQAGVLIVSMDICLLYTSPSPRDQRGSRMPSSA